MIFYFTGSGNSKHIAEKIASSTGDRVINIVNCMQNGQFSFELKKEEALGFVVPVYFMGIPIIVLDFLKKLKVSSEQDFYSYLVLNCGGTTADAEGIFKRVFPVKAVFGVLSVDNYVPIYKIENEAAINECLDKAEKEVEDIVRHIKARDTGSFDTHRKRLPRLYSFIGCRVFIMGRKTGKFTVNENCVSCGLCAKVCPRRIIKLENDKPVWTAPQCELCFGCLHRCPTAAINYGKRTTENGRYLNPRTQL